MIGRWGAAVRHVGLTLAMLVALGACAPEPPASLTRTSHPTTLVGTTWRLAALEGRQPPGDRDLTITFGRTEIAGEGPCNSFGATYGYLPASGALQVGGLVATKRACVEPARSEFEAVYFRTLGGASDASIDSAGRLVISGSGSEAVFEVGPVLVPAQATPSSSPGS